MATWIIKIGAEYVRYSGPLGVARTTTQRLAVRFATRAAARETVSEIAILQRPIGQGRIVRLRTREEKRIAELEASLVMRREMTAWLHQTVNDLSDQVERLSERLEKLSLDFRCHDHDEDDFH